MQSPHKAYSNKNPARAINWLMADYLRKAIHFLLLSELYISLKPLRYRRRGRLQIRKLAFSFIVVPCFCFMTSCHRTYLPFVVASFPAPDGEVPIVAWRIVGAFSFNCQELAAPSSETLSIGLNHDYLRTFGLPEGSVTARALPNIFRNPMLGPLEHTVDGTFISAHPGNNIVTLATKESHAECAVAYLATEIDSPADQHVAIAAGADDHMRLWLNNSN
jgi:hypothetical protein